MTLGEVQRAVESYDRKQRFELKKQAQFIYIQGRLTQMAVASCLDSKAKYPHISEIFPDMFEDDREEQKRQLEVARFKAFANAYNQKLTLK